MTEGHPRNLIVLALLAVLVGAVVPVAQATGSFTPWEAIVGLIIIFTARAFGAEVSAGLTSESIAFSMIMAAGIVFCIGFLMDQVLLYLNIVRPNANEPGHLISRQGYVSLSEQDEIYLLLWIVVTALVLIGRSITRKL